MRPDITGIGRVLAIISQPKYAAKSAVTAAASDLAKLIAAPPTTTLFTVSYSQTAHRSPTSRRSPSRRGDDIDTLTFTIPLIIGLVGWC